MSRKNGIKYLVLAGLAFFAQVSYSQESKAQDLYSSFLVQHHLPKEKMIPDGIWVYKENPEATTSIVGAFVDQRKVGIHISIGKKLRFGTATQYEAGKVIATALTLDDLVELSPNNRIGLEASHYDNCDEAIAVVSNVNGQVHGPAFYFLEGRLRLVANIANDTLQGHLGLFERNGTIEMRCQFKDGFMHGDCKIYKRKKRLGLIEYVDGKASLIDICGRVNSVYFISGRYPIPILMANNKKSPTRVLRFPLHPYINGYNGTHYYP